MKRYRVFFIISWNQNKINQDTFAETGSLIWENGNVHGMLQFIDNFKKRLPYVSTQSFNDGEINVRITNDTSDFGKKCPDCGNLRFKLII